MQQERLYTVQNWIEEKFAPESRPHPQTVRRWIKSGDLPSTTIGGRVYVVEAPEEDVPAKALSLAKRL